MSPGFPISFRVMFKFFVLVSKTLNQFSVSDNSFLSSVFSFSFSSFLLVPGSPFIHVSLIYVPSSLNALISPLSFPSPFKVLPKILFFSDFTTCFPHKQYVPPFLYMLCFAYRFSLSPLICSLEKRHVWFQVSVLPVPTLPTTWYYLWNPTTKSCSTLRCIYGGEVGWM